MSIIFSEETLLKVLYEGAKTILSEELLDSYDFQYPEICVNEEVWSPADSQVLIRFSKKESFSTSDKRILELESKIEALNSEIEESCKELKLRGEFMAYKGIAFDRDYKIKAMALKQAMIDIKPGEQ